MPKTLIRNVKLISLCICIFLFRHTLTTLDILKTTFFQQHHGYKTFRYTEESVMNRNNVNIYRLSHTRQNYFLDNYKNPCWNGQFPPKLGKEIEAYGLNVTMNELHVLQKAVEHRQQQLYCLPYFMLIGTPKSGSSDIFARITKHPDIANPVSKEPHWWTRGRFAGKRSSLYQYTAFFRHAALMIERNTEKTGNGKEYHPLVTGEGSMSTLWDNHLWKQHPLNRNLSEPAFLIAHNIHSIIPDVKLLVILRNPVTRLFSDYGFFGKDNKTAENFHNFSVEAVQLYNDCFSKYSLRHCVYNADLHRKIKVRLHIGIYTEFLEDWFTIYPRKQFLILQMEKYSRSISSTISNIFEFLQLRTLTSFEMQEVTKIDIRNKNRKWQIVKPLQKTIEILTEFYQPFNRRLAALLHDDIFLWE